MQLLTKSVSHWALRTCLKYLRYLVTQEKNLAFSRPDRPVKLAKAFRFSCCFELVSKCANKKGISELGAS